MFNDSRKNPRKDNRQQGSKSEFREELLAIDRVTRVTTWWRQLRFRVVVLLWDWNGKIGLWTWKSWEIVEARAKAVSDARKNMLSVKIENWTVPYNLKVKSKSAVVMLHPASDWVGIIAWWAVRKVLMVAWYKNVLAKRFGSKNKINNARATIKALQSFK